MTAWLYQMTADKRSPNYYTPSEYRKDVYEDHKSGSFKDALITWDAKKIRSKSRILPRKLDSVVLFFAPTGNKEPGIYGWGVIYDYDAAANKLTFYVVSPSDILKNRPAWDSDIKNLIDNIRGHYPKGTMWEIADEDWTAIQMQVGVKLTPEDWTGKEATVNQRRNLSPKIKDLLGTLSSVEETHDENSGIWDDGGTMIKELERRSQGWVKDAFNVFPGGKPGGCHDTLLVAIGRHDDVEKRILQAFAHVTAICKDHTTSVVFWAVVFDFTVWKKYRSFFKSVQVTLRPPFGAEIALSWEIISKGSVMANRLKGKNAVVTGAGRGIGREVALALAREGACVVVNDLGGEVSGMGSSQRAADEVVTEIKALGGQAVPNYDSVADFKAASQIIDSCIQHFGRIDILCNVAGNYIGRMIYNMSEEEWDKVYQVHLKGTFNCCRHASVHMRRQRYGRIVNTTSTARMGAPGASGYSAAKGGIASLTFALARELGRYGITCNAISPWASTRLMKATGLDAKYAEAAAWLAQEGFSSPEELTGPEYIPPIVVYLCTDYAANINGQIFPCSAGRVALTQEPVEIRGIYKNYKKNGTWTLDELIEMVPKVLVKEQ